MLTTALCTGKFNVIKIAHFYKKIYNKFKADAANKETWENAMIQDSLESKYL